MGSGESAIKSFFLCKNIYITKEVEWDAHLQDLWIKNTEENLGLKNRKAKDRQESQKPSDWIQLSDISERSLGHQNGKVWPLDRKRQEDVLMCLENWVPCFGGGGGSGDGGGGGGGAVGGGGGGGGSGVKTHGLV